MLNLTFVDGQYSRAPNLLKVDKERIKENDHLFSANIRALMYSSIDVAALPFPLSPFLTSFDLFYRCQSLSLSFLSRTCHSQHSTYTLKHPPPTPVQSV